MQLHTGTEILSPVSEGSQLRGAGLEILGSPSRHASLWDVPPLVGDKTPKLAAAVENNAPEVWHSGEISER